MAPLIKPPTGSILRAVDSTRPWAIAMVHGDTGCGKTSVATEYCPQPVHIYNFDGRAEKVVKQAREKGRNVLLGYIPLPIGSAKMPEDKAKQISRESLDLLVSNLEMSYREAEKGNCRTVVLDTGTELSEIIALSVNGKFENVKGDYGKSKNTVNMIWRKMIIDARKANCHLLILARSKEVWINNTPTGALIPRGPEVMEESADFTLLIRRQKKAGDVQFSVKVTNPKLDISQLGEVYTADEWGSYGPFIYSCLLQGMDVDTKL